MAGRSTLPSTSTLSSISTIALTYEQFVNVLKPVALADLRKLLQNLSESEEELVFFDRDAVLQGMYEYYKEGILPDYVINTMAAEAEEKKAEVKERKAEEEKHLSHIFGGLPMGYVKPSKRLLLGPIAKRESKGRSKRKEKEMAAMQDQRTREMAMKIAEDARRKIIATRRLTTAPAKRA